MDTLDQTPTALIAIAASMRTAGQSWETIGEEVERHAETVRRWPERYPDQWRATFRIVETQLIAEAAIEGRTVLRALLRAKRGKYRLTAATHLLASNDRSCTREPPPAAEPPGSLCPSCQALKAMSDEELDRMLERFRLNENDETREDGAGI